MQKKWNLQDIRPTDGEKRQKVAAVETPVPEKRGSDMRRREPTPPVPVRETIEEDVEAVVIENGTASKKKRVIISVSIALLVVIGGFVSSLMLGGAEVTINPKYKDVNVGATFTAYTDPETDKLGYELLSLEASGERQVSAKGKENVSLRAEGNLFIYNAFSDKPQRLIKNTRFESKDGLIFRVLESVEVPGRTTDAKGNVVPGVVTAKIFADGTGEQYNLQPSHFTVPGLKGSEQYDSIYGESTEPFTGGFEGEKYIIDPAELETAKQALHTELRDALLLRLESEKPAGFVLFKDAITFTFESLPSTEYGDQLATIKETGHLNVPIFKADELAFFLAKNSIIGYEDSPVSIVDPYKLTFKYASTTIASSDISLIKNLEFSLTGDMRIVWEFNQENLKKDLIGVSKTALPTVLAGYPAIERAEATVKPFWAQNFPKKTDDITLDVVIGDKK